MLILKVENSFDRRLVLKAKEEFPVTDKADRKFHGIGLANIKSTAEKYQGTVATENAAYEANFVMADNGLI